MSEPHGRWLSNISDPANKRVPLDFEDRYRSQWIAANIIGRPKATEKYTVEQLEAMGMVGLYAPLEQKAQTEV